MTSTPDFSLFQIGLNVRDVAAALRFYAEVFGFVNGGGQAGWGHGMRLQGLDPSGQALIWWIVAAEPRTQLELFHHTGPDQRPQPDDWSPADHGWVRIGIAVERFDRVQDRVRERDIPILGSSNDGIRRFAMRDPHSGIIIEVLEDGPSVPGYPRARVHGLDPAIVYATASVSDLQDARHFYGSVIGLPILPLETLHMPGDEALWGLAGASRSGFVVQTASGLIEVVHYSAPAGRPRRPDYRFSDQGIMNVGLFTRRAETVQAVIDRLDAEGRPPGSLVTGAETLGTYVLDAGREVEFFACPPELEAYLGFTPTGFLGVDPEDPAQAGGIRIVHRNTV